MEREGFLTAGSVVQQEQVCERPAMKSRSGIIYISRPSAVRMANKWFEVAAIDHFWIQRRYKVLQIRAGDLVVRARNMAEIGCGNGLLQRQIEDAYGRVVTGCDLNKFALARNISRQSPVLCYNIHQRNEDLHAHFDLIFLFDVLKHIDEQGRFLEAVKFHLVPGGRLIVNVPAGQWAYSECNRVAGHLRRYSIRSLREASRPHAFRIATWSYWGLPFVPALLLRKRWLWGEQDEGKIIACGFDSRTTLVNRCLRLIARCEPIPQRVMGTSLMAALYVCGK